MPRWLNRDLAVAHADGSFGRVLLKLSRIDILLLDDFAMTPLKDTERRDFLEICDDRYQRRSFILTSHVPIAHWHEEIGDPTIADSILDRIVHNAHRVELNGESMKKEGAQARGRRSRMKPPRMQLKSATGWFAAGREVQEALLLLPTAPFACLCGSA